MSQNVDQQPETRNARGAVELAAGGAMINIVFCPAPKVSVPASNNTVVLPVEVPESATTPFGRRDELGDLVSVKAAPTSPRR